MKLDIVANSRNDNFYTPPYAIEPLLKYIKPKSTILCPFDTEDSYFVKMLRAEGHNVINTHIDTGDDFFDVIRGDLCGVEYIISNPPYSIKGKILKALFELNMPFAMLVGVVGLFESKERFEMFKNNDFEIMYFDKRISYFKDYADQRPSLNPPFSSVYVCKNILPKQIVFETVNKNKLCF